MFNLVQFIGGQTTMMVFGKKNKQTKQSNFYKNLN